MSDIATLGLAIDSRTAVTAASNLDKLAASGKTAQVAATALTKATNDTAHAHVGLSGQAQAAAHSVRSMVESLAIGTPVTQVLSQQISHLSYAATGPGGLSSAFKQAGGAILGLLSPVALVVGGLAAIAAGTIYAFSSIAKLEKQLEDAARTADTSIQSLRGFATAAAFKGIDNADFLKGMEKFGASVYDAKNNMGGLAETFRANNTSASTFDEYLLKASNLIKNASSDQQRLQLLQQMGLPATMQWVRFLSQGSDAIKEAAKAADSFNNGASAELVKKAKEFDDAWNKAWKNFSNNAKSAALSSGEAIANAWTIFAQIQAAKNGMQFPNAAKINQPASFNERVGEFATPGNASALQKGLDARVQGGAPKTVDYSALQKRISLSSPLLSLLGQTPAAKPAAKPVDKKEKYDSDRDRVAA